MNTESTIGERLRMAIGAIFAISGSVLFTFGGILGRFNDPSWIIGIILIVLGYLIARSMKIVELIS